MPKAPRGPRARGGRAAEPVRLASPRPTAHGRRAEPGALPLRCRLSLALRGRGHVHVLAPRGQRGVPETLTSPLTSKRVASASPGRRGAVVLSCSLGCQWWRDRVMHAVTVTWARGALTCPLG